jgi:hypothetical protein
MAKKRPPKRTNKRGKVVVLIMVRGPKNSFVRGNKMRVFSVSNSTVDEVADGIATQIAKVRKKNLASKS